MSDDLLKDFDILAPPKRIARIGGEEIDVSIIPARVALQFIAFSKKHDVKGLEVATAESFDSSTLEDMIEIVAMLCKRSNSKITKDWLLDNVDIKVLMEFIQYTFSSIKQADKGAGEGEGSKN